MKRLTINIRNDKVCCCFLRKSLNFNQYKNWKITSMVLKMCALQVFQSTNCKNNFNAKWTNRKTNTTNKAFPTKFKQPRSQQYTPSGYYYKQISLFWYVEKVMYIVHIMNQIHHVFNVPKKSNLLIIVAGGSIKYTTWSALLDFLLTWQ
jgi:hypothetical protein